MSLDFVSDLSVMLRDAGVPVVFNGVASFGILEQADALENSDSGGMMQVKVTTLLIATDAFTDLRVDGRILANGTPYRVDRISPEDDGALTRLYVARLG